MSNVSIVDELLQHSIDSEVSVSQLVKYCSILADDINDAEMASWCEAELDGLEEIPEYRKVYGRLTALDIYNRTTAVGFEDPSTADLYSTVAIRLSISDVEDMAKNTKPGSSYQFMFPDRLAQNLIEANRHVTSVFWIVQTQAFTKIIQHVRNHIFKWAKNLKRKGVVPTGSLPSIRSKVEPKADSQITINAATFNSGLVGTGNTLDSSPVQIAPVNSPQTIDYGASDFQELNTSLDELLKYLATITKTDEIEQLVEEINTYKSLVGQPKPKSSWIAETLSSIRVILENATGTALASYVDKAPLIAAIGRALGLA